MTIAGDNSRPLLPTDEYQINSQFAKHHGISQRGSLNSSIRSTSNRNIAELHMKKPAPLQKALTDTNNFIEMYSKKSVDHKGLPNENNGYGLQEDVSLDNDNEAQYSLDSGGEYSTNDDDDDRHSGNGSDNNSDNNSDFMHRQGMEMDPKMKKQREEWAEKGAAKIVREVTNPKTGKTVRRIVKKGIKDFKFGDTLGDGSYSTVMLATSKDSGKKYAVKVLSKEYLIRQKKVRYVNIEKNALQRLNNSRGIVKLFFTFQDESSLYFLLEYAPNGDFLSVMKKYGSLSEECACYYGAQIIDSINLLHSKGIIHRDIKPENILLDKDMKVKLTDFGTAKILDPKPNSTDSFDLLTRAKSFVGTAEYVSPELLNDNYVDYRCDIWAFGCILFQMIAGKPPFKATNEYLTFQKVMKVQYAFSAGFPLVVRDLVKRILIKQPDQRLTIAEIEKHHFFKDKNFSDGSIWNDPAPEIQPYKITAKSMQPIPALSSGNVLQRRPIFARPYAKSTSNLVTEPGNGHSVPTGSQGRAPPASSVNASSKKVLDERTAQILDNAKRAVGNRKNSNQNKRITSGAASAASAALTKNTSNSPLPSQLTTNAQVNSSQYARPKVSANASYRGTSSFLAQTLSNANSADGSNKVSVSPSGITSGSVRTPSSQKSSNTDNNSTASMTKTDILWSYYLKNIEERVLGVGEVNLAIIENDALEKRVGKIHGSIVDPQSSGTSRSTRLSQVARGGGEVTGFRKETNPATLPESFYYEELIFDHDNVSKDYRQAGGDTSIIYTDDTSASTAAGLNGSSEESGNSAIAGKFKKLFHHGNKQDTISEPIPTNDYFKRMLLVTNLGRCLILVKKAKSPLGSAALNYEPIYEINLCQSGLKVKEIILPSGDDKCSTFALQTPYSSFVCKVSKNSADNWYRTFSRAVKAAHERTMLKSKKDEDQRADALKAARLASPPLDHSCHSLDSNNASPVILSASKAQKAPKTPTLSSSSSDSKHGSTLGKSSGTPKGGRLFDNFVISKEKTPKKHADPVPLPTKLVNGLPASSIQNAIGLGLSDSRYDSLHSPPASPKVAKKTITSVNSRLLARSENSFRPSK